MRIWVICVAFVCVVTSQEVPQEAVGWCVAEDRGNVVPEFKVNKTFVVVDWGGSEDGFYGEASWMLDEELQLTTCMVAIPLPEKVWGSKEMDTVGHEFLHCVIGDFHE